VVKPVKTDIASDKNYYMKVANQDPGGKELLKAITLAYALTAILAILILLLIFKL